MKKIKVLHIITSLGSGGAEGMLYRLILASNHSFEHSVICLNKGGKYVSLLKKENVEVLVLNLKLATSLKGMVPILKFSQLKKKQGYDIITSWLYHADFVAWFLRLIFGFRGLIWNIRYTKLQEGRAKFRNWCFLKTLSIMSNFNVNYIISCSVKAKNIHKKIGYYHKIFSIIPNGYFLDNQKKFNKKLKDYKGTYKICIVARWHPQKDFETIFQALDLIKYKNISFNITIAGSNTNSENKDLIALINKYKLNEYCSLLGEIDNINEIYESSHVTVLSSSYGEAFPNVLAESMLCFTPCVSTDVGDANLILKDVGYIVPIRDYKSLANALLENYYLLINHKDLYLENCLNGFNRVQSNYDIKNIADKYCNLWRTLV